MKAGFAGDDVPRTVFLTIFGWKKHSGVFVGMVSRNWWYGEEALARRYGLNLKCPFDNGVISNWQNWDAMEKIWHETFNLELGVAPSEHAVLLTDNVFYPKESKKRMTQIDNIIVPYGSMIIQCGWPK